MDGKNTQPFEIERKFLIEYPDFSWLGAQTEMKREEIAQTYLLCAEGEERRVRRRFADGKAVYVQTIKRPFSGAKRIEIEEEITKARYDALLLQADSSRRTIEKVRFSFPYAGHALEIDVYPFWGDRAILEIELSAENESISLPQQIRIIREVTDDPRYKNAALAQAEDPHALK